MEIVREITPEIEKRLKSKQAITIVGPRRSGKTTLLNYFYRHPSVETRPKIFFDLENIVERRLWELENYKEIAQEIVRRLSKGAGRPHIFIDEIQYCKNLPSVVKYLYDHFGWKFFLTGSSSFYIKNYFTESLSGRKYIFELYPFSFSEFLTFKGESASLPKLGEAISEPVYNALAPHLEEYFTFGGFPEVVKVKSAAEKKQMLTDIYTSYFQHDVVQLSNFTNNKVLDDFIRLLTARIGSKVDFAKLASELGVNRITAQNMLNFLEATFLVRVVRPYSKRADYEIKKSPKVFFIDNGLVSLFGRASEGQVFESGVFTMLRGFSKLNYYQRKSGEEIDFVANEALAFEAKVSASQADIKQLTKLSEELGFKKWFVISKKYNSHSRVRYAFQL